MSSPQWSVLETNICDKPACVSADLRQLSQMLGFDDQKMRSNSSANAVSHLNAEEVLSRLQSETF